MARARKRFQRVVSGLMVLAFVGTFAGGFIWSPTVNAALGGDIPLGLPFLPGLDLDPVRAVYVCQNNPAFHCFYLL